MKSRNKYYLGKRAEKIKDAADYLNNNQEKYKNKIVYWTKLREDVLKLDTPECNSEVKSCTEQRSVWVRNINEQCTRMEYSIYLVVIPAKGCKILTGKDAVDVFMLKRVEKALSTNKETVRQTKGMGCKFPEYEKRLGHYSAVMEDISYSIRGRMSMDPELADVLQALPDTIK